MENIEEFTTIIMNNIMDYITAFDVCCLVKDICFKNYCYRPEFRGPKISHIWEHQYNANILTVTDIKLIFQTSIFNLINDLHNAILKESQKYEPSSTYEWEVNEWEVIQRKMKKISEILIMFQSGEVFKEFVDCYRKGYFE
jgi:hypothetical protein